MRPGLTVALLLIFVGLLPASAALAAAEEGMPHGRVAVDFRSDEGQPAWLAEALEQRAARELSRFTRVELLDPLPAGSCPSFERDCVLDAMQGQGVDVVVTGTVRDLKLRYEVLETWTRGVVFSGSISLDSGMSSARLDHLVGNLVRPIVQSGGILDRKPELESADGGVDGGAQAAAVMRPSRSRRTSIGFVLDAGVATDGGEAAGALSLPPPPAPGGSLGWVLALFGGLLALLVSPVVAAYSLRGVEVFRRRPLPASWSRSLVLAGVVLVVAALELIPATAGVWSPLQGVAHRGFGRLLMHLIAGGLWAAFLLLHAALVFPRVQGMGRVRDDTLGVLLASWVRVSVTRLVALLALYVPLALAAEACGKAVGLSDRALWLFAMPALGLLCYFWLLCVVDNFSLYLDSQLVLGDASARNPWHLAARRYFRGYVRRTGLDLSPELLSRALFLPGKREGVVCYGGGLAAPRVVINAELLELALGPQQASLESTERDVNLEHLPFGMLFPAAAPSKVSDPQRRAERGDRLRREKTENALARGFAPRIIGEHTTLLGWVLPLTVDESVPLISNTHEDYEVVQSLLTEHYAAFEAGSDDEYDDTDPTQKDFLFGAILRELGTVRRGESLLTTVRLAFAEQAPQFSRPFRFCVRWLQELHQRFASRPVAILADAYAALNFARDPLVQYLQYLRDPAAMEPLLTNRADAAKYAVVSREILERVAAETPQGPDRHFFRATPRNRLVSLSRFFYAGIPEQRERKLRLVLTAGGWVALAAVIGGAALNAANYDSVYTERMRQMRERMEQSQQGEADGGTQ